MSIVAVRPREAFPVAVSGLAIIPAGPGLWRIARPDGAVLGHVERHGEGDTARFTARRHLAGGRPPVQLGEFWSPAAAVELFR